MSENVVNYKGVETLPILEEVPETANAIIEVDGAFQRVPGSMLGGSGIKTAIIKASNYDEVLKMIESNSGASEVSSDEITYSCLNMTFEEARETFLRGEPMAAVVLMTVGNTAVQASYLRIDYVGKLFDGEMPVIVVYRLEPECYLFWTPDGISTTQPGSSSTPV